LEHVSPPHGQDVECSLVGDLQRDRHLTTLIGRSTTRDPRQSWDQECRGRRAQAFFSRWPPKANRMAERSRSAYSSQPREHNRSNRGVLSTPADTPSSMAAWMVQRPSPESETLPEKPARSGLCKRACVVRSSSQEAMTLPRRQTSAMSATFRSY